MLKLYWDEEVYDCDKCFLKAPCDKDSLDRNCSLIGTYQIKDVPEDNKYEPEPEYIDVKESLYELAVSAYKALLKKGVKSDCEAMRACVKHITEYEIKNKPKPEEKWETCTRENTKVGEEVRNIYSCRMRTVKYILDAGETFIGMDKIKGNGLLHVRYMENYEINTAKEK